jgi:uncharacterized protein YndB with AHSA1/START domain
MEPKSIITVDCTVDAALNKVWDCWTNPQHIIHWNFASLDWHSPKAENDLQVEGHFTYRMEAKDGSMGFDFAGTYTEVKPMELIEYKMADDRKVKIVFLFENGKTKVTESFEAENTNPHEFQKAGWQAILYNFKKHVESL